MKKPKMEEAQIIAALLRLEDGYSTALLCWELGITMSTIEVWRKTYAEGLRQAIADRETDTLVARLLRVQADSEGSEGAAPASSENPKGPRRK